MAAKTRKSERDGKPAHLSATASQEKRSGAQQKRTKNNKSEQPTFQPARLLNKSDWQLIQYAVVAEGMSYAAAGREARLHPASIRMRAKRERWHDQDQIRLLPTTEEIIIMRNQREIMRTLKVMDGKLESAMQSASPEEAKLAGEKAELLGKFARANQSLARASEVAASNKRRVKANVKPTRDTQADRETLTRQLTEIDAKVERAKLPEQSEPG